MYSIVLIMALSGGAEAPAFDNGPERVGFASHELNRFHRCCGCYGGCWGCYGCYGCGYSCCGGCCYGCCGGVVVVPVGCGCAGYAAPNVPTVTPPPSTAQPPFAPVSPSGTGVPPVAPGWSPGTGVPPVAPGSPFGTGVPGVAPGSSPGTGVPPVAPGSPPGTGVPPVAPGSPFNPRGETRKLRRPRLWSHYRPTPS